jgi:cell wall-associated NlpC family hydrolase
MAKGLRRVAIGVGSTALALVAVLAQGVPAQAKPTPAQLASQINKLNDQIETLGEQYNLARVKLGKDAATKAALEKQIAPAQLEATLAHQQIGIIASKVYMSGPNSTLQTMLATSDTADLLAALGTLNEMASQQGKTINGAQAKLSAFKIKEAPIAALVAKEQAQVKAMSAKKKQIDVQLKALQKLQDAALGQGSGNAGPGVSGSGPYTKSQVMPHACPAVSGSGKGYSAAVKACSLIWRPGVSRYKDPGKKGWIMYHLDYASESSGYDCSGLVMTAWKSAGISMPHSSYAMRSDYPKHIAKSALVPGDLVFYNSTGHVAIYVGAGWIVQAAHTGAPIEMSPIGSPGSMAHPS